MTGPVAHRHDLAPGERARADAQREVIELHVAHLRWRRLSHTTLGARRRALRRLAGALPCPLLQAGPAELHAWRAGLRVGEDAVRGYISHAHQFYEWARAAGQVAANPAAGLPKPRKRRTLPRPITEAELIAALDGAPPRVRPWLVLAGWAGLRAKEIALLRRECVFDQAAQPAILIASDATKGRDERIVPMSAFVLSEMRPRLPERGYVFPRGDSQPGPNAPHTISRNCNEYLHSIGSAATLHQLRHRFGTQAYRGSGDLRAVQELLGHRDPKTTAGYAAYDQAAAAAAVEAIPAPGLSAVPALETIAQTTAETTLPPRASPLKAV